MLTSRVGQSCRGGIIGHYEGFYRWTREGLSFEDIDRTYASSHSGIRYSPADFIFNFFIAKTEALRLVRWDEQFHASWEHEDFFLSAHKAGLKTVYCPDSVVVHRGLMADPMEYDQTRHRDDSRVEQVMIKKWGFREQQLIHEYAGRTASDTTSLSDKETAHAPRVLNAAFRKAQDETIVAPNHALRAGGDYDLLVDIGPRWSKIKSLVHGQAEFPQYALDPKETGHKIDVLFVSEDFTPHVVTAHLWLPQGAGRSHPIVNGERAKNSGPLALRLHAPELGNPGGETITAKGRLCLYYRNNLLQAASVSVTVAAERALLEHENTVDVDFVLTSTFQELEARFTGRTLNLMLNDDGEGGHRIVAMGGPDSAWASAGSLPAGWVPYNPSGATKLLDNAREKLLDCFYLRDSQGKLTKDDALNKQCGKSKDQFRYDLRELSRVGGRVVSTEHGAVHMSGTREKELQENYKTSKADPHLEWALEDVAATAKPDTILGWYRQLLANKFDGSKFRRSVGLSLAKIQNAFEMKNMWGGF